jgi:hypothetical protein
MQQSVGFSVGAVQRFSNPGEFRTRQPALELQDKNTRECTVHRAGVVGMIFAAAFVDRVLALLRCVRLTPRTNDPTVSVASVATKAANERSRARVAAGSLVASRLNPCCVGVVCRAVEC